MRSLAEVPGNKRLLLLPATAMAAVVVVLVGLVCLRFSLGPWLPGVAAAGAGGIFWSLRHTRWRGLWWVLVIVVTWVVLGEVGERAVPWPVVSANPDAWSYGAMASYLTDYPRGTTEGMPLVDQYASHLRDTRFASPGLLALAVYFTGSDHLYAAHTAFYLLCLATLIFSTGYLSETLGLSRRQSLIAAGITALSGWIVNLITVGNYDNLLFIAIWPAALGVLLEFIEGTVTSGPFIATEAVLSAALICTYPEYLALAAVFVTPLGCFLLWRYWSTTRICLGCCAAGLVALLLASPYLPTLIVFIRGQLATTAAFGGRPGEGYFGGLLGPRFAPAFFALGSEFPGASDALILNLLPLVALVLVAIGAWRLSARWPWFPWVGAGFIALLLWQAVIGRYSYGTFKVILCGSWWLFPAMVSGGAWLSARLNRPIVASVTFGLLAVAAAAQRHSQQTHRIWPPDQQLSAFDDLASLRVVTQDQPVVVDVDSDFEQNWVVSFLKPVPLILARPRGYLAMPHVQSYLARTRFVPMQSEVFVLRSGPRLGAVWQNLRFALCRESVAHITTVENPNGLESLDGLPFLWIASSHPTVFSITAYRAGPYTLSAQGFLIGPSAPGEPRRVLEVSDVTGVHSVTVSAGDDSIPIALQVGVNRVVLRSRTLPVVRQFPNGDTRELLLGLKGYFLKNTPAFTKSVLPDL